MIFFNIPKTYGMTFTNILQRRCIPTSIVWKYLFQILLSIFFFISAQKTAWSYGAWMSNKLLSHVWLCVTLWTVACQTPLSMGFSRQEYWSGLPYRPPRYVPDPGIEPISIISPALAGRIFTISTTWKAPPSAHIWVNW